MSRHLHRQLGAISEALPLFAFKYLALDSFHFSQRLQFGKNMNILRIVIKSLTLYINP